MQADESLAPHFEALGRMLVAFQYLEGTVTDGLLSILSHEASSVGQQLSYAVVSELSFASASRLASLLPAFITVKSFQTSSDTKKQLLIEELTHCAQTLEAGLKLAGEVEQRRNQLVHSHWFIGHGFVNQPGKMARMKVRVKARSINMQFEQESVADLAATTNKAEQAMALIGESMRLYINILNHSW